MYCVSVALSTVPGLGEVGPVGHDHGTQHDVVLGEVAGEELRGSDHGQAEHIRDLVPVGGIGPRWHLSIRDQTL